MFIYFGLAFRTIQPRKDEKQHIVVRRWSVCDLTIEMCERQISVALLGIVNRLYTIFVCNSTTNQPTIQWSLCVPCISNYFQQHKTIQSAGSADPIKLNRRYSDYYDCCCCSTHQDRCSQEVIELYVQRYIYQGLRGFLAMDLADDTTGHGTHKQVRDTCAQVVHVDKTKTLRTKTHTNNHLKRKHCIPITLLH